MAVPESTVCGWKYGLSYFYRSHSIGSSDKNGCGWIHLEKDDGVQPRITITVR